MDPIQAINTLSQVVKSAKLPYNDHVLLERCVDVLVKEIQSKSDGGTTSDISNVTFDETEVVADVEATAKPKARARARAKKGGK
jgi:hypothetical protein